MTFSVSVVPVGLEEVAVSNEKTELSESGDAESDVADDTLKSVGSLSSGIHCPKRLARKYSGLLQLHSDACRAHF